MPRTTVKRIWIEYVCPCCFTKAREDVVFDRIKRDTVGAYTYKSRCPDDDCAEMITVELNP